jgi:Uma2 family endonuclease
VYDPNKTDHEGHPMTTKTIPVTAEDLLDMPNDGFRYELVKGELKRMTPAGDEHGYVALELGAELRNYVKANDLGRVYAAETGFKLASDPDTVLTPDVAFVERERVEGSGRIRGFRSGPGPGSRGRFPE